MGSSTRVHLVLAAGGVKTLSYPAAIHELCSSGLEIASISAASGGSFFGALLASGMTPKELRVAVESFDLRVLAGERRPFAAIPLVGAMWRWPFAKHRESGLLAHLGS